MRQTIRKSDLKRLVEGVLNELDWKTYMNAAQKRQTQGRRDDAEELRDYAADNFRDKYDANGTFEDYGFKYRKGSNRYVYDMAEDWYGYWDEDGDFHDEDEEPIRKPHYNDAKSYYNRDAKYVKGKGWENESRRRNLVNNITESVIRKLRGRRPSRRR